MPKRTPEQKAARKIADAENRKRNHAALLAAEKKYREEHAEELRIYKAQWKKDNPEKVKESRRLHKKSRPRTEAEKAARKNLPPAVLESERAKSRQWHLDNPQRTKENRKAYYAREDVKDRIREKYRLEFKKNPEKFRARARAERKKHRIRYALRQRARDAAKRRAGGTVTEQEIMGLWEKQAGKCVFFATCGNLLVKEERRQWHIDHIEPIAPKDKSKSAGRHVIDNLQLLCGPCNMKKHNTDPYQFAQQNGLLFCDIVDIQRPKRKKKSA